MAERHRPSEILVQNRSAVVEIAKTHKADNVRVFGSAARGEDGPDSDIDILVDLKPGATLFDLASLRADLVDLLGIAVDIVDSRSIGPAMARILREAVPL